MYTSGCYNIRNKFDLSHINFFRLTFEFEFFHLISCLRFGITGTWLEFEHLITTWIKNRNTKRSDLSLPYPKLQRINPTLPQSCQNLLQNLNPIQDISSQQFKELLKNLKLLRRDFEIKDFSKFDARVNEDLTEIYFPIR